jgi:hypothetical protein
VTAQAQSHLDTANTALTALQTASFPPPTALSDLSTATQPLATLLRQTADAAGVGVVIGAVTGLPAINDAMQRLVKAVGSAGGNGFGGLVTDLGLPAAGATVESSLTVAGSLVMCTLGNATRRSVGGGDVFALSDSRLDASLSTGTMRRRCA